MSKNKISILKLVKMSCSFKTSVLSINVEASYEAVNIVLDKLNCMYTRLFPHLMGIFCCRHTLILTSKFYLAL